MLNDKKIAVLGAGKLGESLIKGLLDAQDAGGSLRLRDADFGCSASPHIACGQVDDCRAVACFGHPEQRSTTRLFHIVGMGGNGEHIQVGWRTIRLIGHFYRIMR